MKTRIAVSATAVAALILIAAVVLLVATVVWRAEACGKQGAEAARTDNGHVVCVHPDGTVSKP